MALTYKDGNSGTDEGNPAGPVTSGAVNVAVGNLVVVTVTSSDSNTAPNEVSDDAGNTYTARTAVAYSSTVRQYWCVATEADASNTVTCTFTGTGYTYVQIVVSVWTVDAGDDISVEDSVTSTVESTTAIDTGDATSVEADTLWICGVSGSGPRALSDQDIGGAATIVASPDSGRGHQFYHLPGEAQTADATGTLADPTSGGVELIVFKSVAGAGGSVVPIIMQQMRRRRG